MKKRFSEEQIIGFLREAEAGVPVKELEAENARLKKLLAEQLLENAVTRMCCDESGERTGSA